MKHFIGILLILVTFSCGNQVENNTPKIKVTEFETFGRYGEAPIFDDDYCNTVTEKYGFRVKFIDGCEITSAKEKEIIQHNRKALKSMNKRYGKDWLKRFKNENQNKLELDIPFSNDDIIWQDILSN